MRLTGRQTNEVCQQGATIQISDPALAENANLSECIPVTESVSPGLRIGCPRSTEDLCAFSNPKGLCNRAVGSDRCYALAAQGHSLMGLAKLCRHTCCLRGGTTCLGVVRPVLLSPELAFWPSLPSELQCLRRDNRDRENLTSVL